MNARAKAWWLERTPREQQLLLGLGVLLLLLLLWLLVVAPVRGAAERAERRYAAAAEQLSLTQMQAAQIRALRGEEPARLPPGRLAAVVRESAAAAGVTIARAQPDATGELGIAIEAVRPAALFGWLAGLERAHGVAPVRLAVRKNADASLSADLAFEAAGA